MKKIICAMTALTLSLGLLSGCGGGSTPAPESSNPVESSTAAPVSSTPATPESSTSDITSAPAAEISGEFIEGPFVVTTCGQSPGAVMLNMVAMQAGKTSVAENTLTADTLVTEGNKTLIVATGTSMKGMGAAGTDVNSEITRCTEVIKKAKEAGMVIVGAHVEGMARRTDSSDAASIDAVISLADVILVIEDSDSDGFFTEYAQKNNKPIIKTKDALSISSVLK